ncbi:hypothetical protein, partial [Streptococcus pseudopneumoniae]
WKPSSASYTLRTKQPGIGAFEESWFEQYIQGQNAEDQPELPLSEAELQELRDQLRPMETKTEREQTKQQQMQDEER